MDHTQKLKRVTLNRIDLERALIILFKEKKEYRLKELEVRLNHPVGTLKAAIKNLCCYDLSRKVYSLRI